MQTQAEILDLAKVKLGLTSDYQLEKFLGIKLGSCGRFRKNKGYFNQVLAYRLAEIVDADPLAVISICEAGRAKSAELQEFWRERAEQYILCKIFGFEEMTDSGQLDLFDDQRPENYTYCHNLNNHRTHRQHLSCSVWQ